MEALKRSHDLRNHYQKQLTRPQTAPKQVSFDFSERLGLREFRNLREAKAIELLSFTSSNAARSEGLRTPDISFVESPMSAGKLDFIDQYESFKKPEVGLEYDENSRSEDERSCEYQSVNSESYQEQLQRLNSPQVVEIIEQYQDFNSRKSTRGYEIPWEEEKKSESEKEIPMNQENHEEIHEKIMYEMNVALEKAKDDSLSSFDFNVSDSYPVDSLKVSESLKQSEVEQDFYNYKENSEHTAAIQEEKSSVDEFELQRANSDVKSYRSSHKEEFDERSISRKSSNVSREKENSKRNSIFYENYTNLNQQKSPSSRNLVLNEALPDLYENTASKRSSVASGYIPNFEEQKILLKPSSFLNESNDAKSASIRSSVLEGNIPLHVPVEGSVQSSITDSESRISTPSSVPDEKMRQSLRFEIEYENINHFKNTKSYFENVSLSSRSDKSYRSQPINERNLDSYNGDRDISLVESVDKPIFRDNFLPNPDVNIPDEPSLPDLVSHHEILAQIRIEKAGILYKTLDNINIGFLAKHICASFYDLKSLYLKFARKQKNLKLAFANYEYNLLRKSLTN